MSYSKSNYHSSLFYDFKLYAIKLNQCPILRYREFIEKPFKLFKPFSVFFCEERNRMIHPHHKI